jgi:hypothetical protein
MSISFFILGSSLFVTPAKSSGARCLAVRSHAGGMACPHDGVQAAPVRGAAFVWAPASAGER